MGCERASERAFFGASTLLFTASTAVTIVWCASMSTMGKMPICGALTIPMAWMQVPGVTWLGAAASFLSMWIAMMAPMMLPSLVPMLGRYRQAVGRAGERLNLLTALVGAGYFVVWTLFGLVAFALSVSMTEMVMQLPTLASAAPIAIGAVILISGALQFTAWKAHHLARYREAPGHGHTLPAGAATA